MRKFEPMKADEMWARYIEEAKRDVPAELGEHILGAITRKKLEKTRSEGVDLPSDVPKRVEKAQFARANTTACSGVCPKCGALWRGNTSCRSCGHRFSAVMF